MKIVEEKNEVTIVFAGDSGDGIQLTGTQFTTTNALFGNDISTFPDYPAEIRAPQGTVAGVSGFQLKFGSNEVYTPGDICDVLVAMNAAALKVNLPRLRKNGTIILNTDGFNAKDIKLAKYENNPLEDKSLDDYRTIQIDVSKLTKAALVDSGMGKKEIDRSRNMFVLGFLYYMYSRKLENTEKFIKEKFAKKPELIDANLKVLNAGYNYADTSEIFTSRYNVKAAELPKGEYRSIMGNQATAIGLVAASQKAGLDLFYGTYPITPASDILHELAKHKNFGVKTFQAEDEIAAICSVIGAAFGGKLGVTASSGPGIALKGEAIGLGVMLELPMVICNVQRGGPSTGLPTKTEQSDLLQAIYGRNGEAPMPVIAASSPSDCFETVYEAVRIAIEHMTPVFFLSDGYIANGSEPWKFPNPDSLKEIKAPFINGEVEKPFLPYRRDQNFVRRWAIPGVEGLEHRIGGLEKQDETGDVSYDPENHEKMVKIRQAKVDAVVNSIPLQEINNGLPEGEVLVIGWGSTFGVIKTAVKKAVEEGVKVGHIHLRYLNPLPKNLGELIQKFDHVIVPEMNNGQLVKILRDKYLVDAKGINKIKGIPFSTQEIIDAIEDSIIKV
ncbi:MAG: 2-oxoacid:acceptor oxidoreductase subunit alpha [Bacteroidetes bacterium]|nr:MAG: 2-oxoacid:acceptor oxidoreductase subunit alpha [Bacteroidota bacterium]MBL1143404.1 2-oxoacid:acceptor oxidoreductase subunit alpha [Bacteroidota bacterium]NOG56208.1 2-oxoacid:acceptor oxidoreductase subunit alpha [Bacteroidota bacterium]